MSDTVQHINYVGEAELFANEINQSDNGIYCLALLHSKESSDISPERIDPDQDINSPVEKIVLEALELFNATALYCDIIVNNGESSAANICPSYFSGLLNSGLVIQSPLFVRNNPNLKLKHNPNIKVFHCHNYLRQIEQYNSIIHIPEELYTISVNSETLLNMQEDLKILNE